MLDFLSDPVHQTASLRERGHRPWPLPRKPCLLGQTWRHLLFAHWAVEPRVLGPLVRPPVALDTFEGRAWIGVTPFVLTGLRPSVAPPLPGVSSFPELNVRTYVTFGGKPGIWFFSLDAASRLAVAAARRFYRLPYFLADMASARRDGLVEYRSARVDTRGRGARFTGRYRPVGLPGAAMPGSLEYFLAERYCLYTVDAAGKPFRADIHHPPWPLQAAEAEIDLNTMAPRGVELPDAEPLLHYAARQDVLIWSLTGVAASETVRGRA